MAKRPAETVASPAPMTRARFGDYVRALAPLMRLGHWEVETPDEPPKDESAWASVNCWDGKFGATVRVSASLLTEPERTQRECAAHELVHCHLAHADGLAEKCMGPKESAAWRLANEYAVSALAQVLAPFLPLPSEVMDRKGKGGAGG